MAINQHHLFEDLEGVKCAIVEKNVEPSRVEFLKKILEFNGYTVVVAASPAPKATTPVAEGEVPPAVPTTFTLGVSDVTFNSTNAIFGRLLRTPEGAVVTLDYWKQRTPISQDQQPYFQR